MHHSAMIVKDALVGAGFARSDGEVLLARILGKDRSWLLAHPEYTLTEAEWTRWAEWSERRRSHEPVAYIIGEWEFYGRPFTVDKRALIPRGSTEGVVAHALAFLRTPFDAVEEVDEKILVISTRLRDLPSPSLVIDIGTGTGAIAITLALERPDLHLIATDISPDALALATENAKRHRVESRMEFRAGSALDPIVDVTEPFLLVSNPPYIHAGRTLMKDVVDFEPHVALFGGTDGAAIIRTIWQQAKAHKFCAGVVMECGEEHATLAA